MRSALWAMGLLPCLLWSAAAEANGRPVVAVFTLKGEGTTFKQRELESVSEYVSTQLVASGRFTVVPRSEVKRTLANQKKKSYQACYDESCQIEIGKELAADKVVVGSIRKFGGDVCMVNLRLFDLTKSASERGGVARGKCGHDKVLASVDQAVAGLTGAAVMATAGAALQPIQPPPPIAAPPPVAAPPSSVPPPLPNAKGAANLVEAGRPLATTRRRRSYLRNMAKMERTLCQLRRDHQEMSTRRDAVCKTAPKSGSCRRWTRRLARVVNRSQATTTKRSQYLAKAASGEGQAYAQALDGYSRVVSACWCDPKRNNKRACRVP